MGVFLYVREIYPLKKMFSRLLNPGGRIAPCNNLPRACGPNSGSCSKGRCGQPYFVDEEVSTREVSASKHFMFRELNIP